MIREVERDIYAIDVPLKGNPLKALNSYFIRGKERDLLIDTGFRRDSCREALEEALKNLESERARRSVLCTHLHSDHSGMADLFAGDNQPIHMSEADTRLHCRFATGEARKISHERFLKEGFPSDILALVYSTNPARTETMPPGDPRMSPLRDGQVIRVGEYELQTVLVPGHTPGSISLLDKEHRCLIGGDPIQEDGRIFMFGVHRDMEAYITGLQHVWKRESEFDVIYPSHAKLCVEKDIIPKLIRGAKDVMDGKVEGKKAELRGNEIAVYDIGVDCFLGTPQD